MSSDDLYKVEFDGVPQALRREKFKRRLLKIIIRILRKFRSAFHIESKYENNAGMDSAIMEQTTINRFYHRSDSLNNSLDLLAICSDDRNVYEDIQRKYWKIIARRTNPKDEFYKLAIILH